MKKLFFACLAFACVLIACDDSTDTLGTTLINNMDHLDINTDTFTVTTRSIKVDSVYARNTSGYLGTVRDPETGEYITAHFMTQFHTLEDYEFPELDSLVSVDSKGEIIADSCEIRIFWSDYYGDSLSSMKCSVFELAKPMAEGIKYYSNFDPKSEGYIRATSDGGIKVNKSYTLEDMNVERSTRDNTYYSKNIRVVLNDEYTDQDGVTYNNYGTYIMRKYYEEYGGNPDYYKNSYNFINNICPGFYVESVGGLGNMAEIQLTQLNLYFRYIEEDTIYVGTTSFSGTNEVVQCTNYVKDSDVLDALVADATCTYLKTPAGIFTEVTLPVDEICYGHDNDTINSAKFTLQRINNEVASAYTLEPPSTVLIMPKDSLYQFFENKSVANYKTSFLVSYSSSDNTYTFNNIGSMIKAMQQAKQAGETSEDWNKAVIIPVTATYSSTYAITKVTHDMSMTSTRLIGGDDNPNGDIKISVIYSKYE